MFKAYKNISKDIIYLVLAEIALQLMNVSFMFILLIYMQKNGYADYEGAHFIKVRFLSILILSIPLGYYLKGRKIKPLFYFASIVLPTSSFLIIYGIQHHLNFLLYITQITWGAGFVCMQVAGLPYILRNAKSDELTQGISLSHISWSTAGIISAILIFSLGKINVDLFDEKLILQILAGISFISFFFILKIKRDVVEEGEISVRKHDYDWKIIIKAMIPTTIIAVGAGLTIPFISIFFYNVHLIEARDFALAGAITLTLVSFTTLLVPYIKQRFGFRKAVPVTQSIAVFVLVIMACTELWKDVTGIVYLALLCYIVRQPLMNMAGPMTSEITMMYVGKKNQEIVSALTASIWSGSWFFSAQVFEVLRKYEVAYYQVFLMTALLYSIGIWQYYKLIVEFERKKEE